MRILNPIWVAAVIAIAGCSRSPVITITNRSAITLSNVVVSGSGFSQRVGTIPAGGECRLNVHPRGESALRLSFDAGARHVDSGEQGYFEGGGDYYVEATISTNLSVSVSSGLHEY